MTQWIFYGAEFGVGCDTDCYTPQLFFNKESAIEYLKRIISEITEDGSFVIDKEFDEECYTEQDYISCICFLDRQENWNNYCEFFVEPIVAH